MPLVDLLFLFFYHHVQNGTEVSSATMHKADEILLASNINLPIKDKYSRPGLQTNWIVREWLKVRLAIGLVRFGSFVKESSSK